MSNLARGIHRSLRDPGPNHVFDFVRSCIGVRPAKLLALHFQALEEHLIDDFERELHGLILPAGQIAEMRRTTT